MYQVRFLASPLLAIAFCVALAAPAKADMIALYNTGVNADGSLATGGTVDQHYQLLSVPAGAGTTAFVSSAIPLNYDQSGSASKFIGTVANLNQAVPIGDYIYRTTFDLTGFNASTARIVGRFESDDRGEIFLNGSDTGISSADFFFSFTPFTLDRGFVDGLNTLDFHVNNDPNSGGPSALRVELSGNVSAVPEPNTLLLLGIGLVGSLAYARRRRGSRTPADRS